MHVLAQEGGAIDAVFGSFENTMLWLLVAVSFVALAFAYYLVREVLKEAGDAAVLEPADAREAVLHAAERLLAPAS